MDPMQFRIDWEVLFELLMTIIVLSFFVERALSIIVESRLFVNSKADKGPSKEILSFLCSLGIVKYVGFDAMAILFKMDSVTWPGFLITAGVIAGGSKASIKLFRDLMDVKSGAMREKNEKKNPPKPET